MSDVKEAADTPKASEQPADMTGAEKLYGEDKPPVEEKVDDVKVVDDAKADGEEKPSGDEKAPDKEAKEAAKSDDGKKVVPEKYLFEVDDSSPLTDKSLDEIAAYAQEQGLSQEAAQKLVDWQAETLKSHEGKLAESFKETTTKWKETASNDKEIGGTDFNRNVELAKRAVEKFATPEFKKALDDSGFGNHPELLRTFVRIGKSMGEDSLVIPGAQKASGKSMEDLFYGGSKA